MKFLVDPSLGGLAKWLRLLGFDTVQLPVSPDPAASLPAPAAGVFILTRQERLERLARPDVFFLTAPAANSQLEEVIRRLQLTARAFKPLSRCSHCNAPLLHLDREQAQGRVPEYVFHYHDRFFECPRCHRVFWPGSHLRGISRTMKALLQRSDP